MNSIFVRIYGGMIAACCFIGIVFYFSIEATNFFRLQHFRNELVAGPLELMVRSVAQRPAEQREQWVLFLERMMGSRIELRSIDTLSLSSKEISQLARDELVLRLSKEDRRGEAILKIPGEDSLYLYAQGDRITEQQARGVTIMLADYLGRHDVSEWDVILAEVNDSFGFPVRRVPPHQISLNRGSEVRLFKHHEVVVQFHEQRGGSTLITAMVLLPQTGEILYLGPQDMFNWYPIELLGAMLIIALAMVGLAAYLLVRPLESRLSRMERAVLRIRGGDLSARAPVEGSDAIGQLAGTLNGMAEHIQRLISAQKELSRAVSHELRTPVARIRFGLEMLFDEPDPVRRQKNFDDIDNDIEQLDKLIDEILTYSKLEEGTPVLDFTMINVDLLLYQIEEETNALGKDIKIIYESPHLSEQKCFAEGEERYVHRVVQNFVGNALRYANSKVVFRFSVIGDVFRVDVEDDGQGIPEEDRKRVFQPFTRLDDSRTRASGGYGLGLSIVARIAFWHGGKVKVSESSMGGAKFSFIWPRLQSMRDT